ncbi:MAG: hypothetical protein M5R37_11250 [Melioribacteraceae bacterium]|nr:hypothetical protein [Melioribacteraceae bacterium]
MLKKITLSICLVLLVVISTSAQNSGKHEHDGFFMRFLAGPSYSTQVYDGAPSEMEVKGLSASFGFQIGATIAENLIAFGEVSGSTITNPDIEINGTVHETDETKSSSFGFGGGITYYIMPLNFYFTASVLASKMKMEYTKGSVKYEGESDMGIGVFAGVGKEWWIADDWALGACAFFSYANVPDKGSSDITIACTTFGIAFSATFQ